MDTILEMAQHKTAGRAQKLIVAGCLVERYRNEIRKNIPEVDAVVGTGELQQILNAAGIATPSLADSPFLILNSRSEGDAREAAGRFSKAEWDGAIADLPNYLYDENTPRLLATPKYSAYIKIAEGCDHPCSFCIIPQLRGKFRSRRFESVVAEAQRLAEQGVREITLIGQDTTCYGEDLGLKDGLALLLERLAQIEKLRWVRFLYAYPNKITSKLLKTIAAHEKICSYIDVPLQHAAPEVLKRMKRGAGAEIFLRSVEKMRREIPDLTLRTSFIVGFPGESVDDFDQLCQFVRESNSTGWECLATPTKKEQALLHWPIKSRRERSSGAVRNLCPCRNRSAARKSAPWWDASSTCSCRVPQLKPTCCGKAVRRCMLPKLMARFT